MKLLILIVLVGLVFANADKYEYIWKDWKLKNNKVFFSPKKEDERKITFIKNVDEVEAHNEKFAKGEVLFTKSLNAVSDLTHEQFLKRRTGVNTNVGKAKHSANRTVSYRQSPPESVDLRSEGGIGEVRDQSSCGSCWTFSACAALEWMHWKNTGEFVDCAEQQLVDCVYLSSGHSGCEGGWMDEAIDYVKNSQGIAAENDYSYTAQYGNCRDSEVYKAITVDSNTPVNRIALDENSVKNALVDVGVLTLCVDVTEWQQYSSGILSSSSYADRSPQCQHAINIVGYGTENDTPYYIVRNSWGTWWGEQGYARLDARIARQGYYTVTYGGFMYQGIFAPNP